MITTETFKLSTGCDPQHGDLQRCNCPEAGKFGHQQCGWCDVCEGPRFKCRHLAELPTPTAKPTWQLVKNFVNGHRYFKLNGESDKIYVADQSGLLPDLTDDGVLYFVPGLTGSKIYADWKRISLTVIDKRGEPNSTPLCFDEALWLSTTYRLEIQTHGGMYVVQTSR